MRHWLAWLLVAIGPGASALTAQASGWAADEAVSARAPSHRALIHFADGRQRLVLESAFAGPRTNFTWVLPLPSVPEIEQAGTGLFPTLSHIFQPRIIVEVRPWWLYLMVLAGLGGIIRLVHGRYGPWAAVGSGALLVSAALLLKLGVFLTRDATLPVGQLNDVVRRLGPQTALIEDVSLLPAPADDALPSWLAQHGFDASAEMTASLAAYARQGWTLVALKARPDTPASGIHALPAVSFTFPTPRPVCPLWLNPEDRGPRQLDLYVFGPARASASGLRSRRVSQARAGNPQTESGPLLTGGPLRLRHPELRRMTDGSEWASWLQGTVLPEETPEGLRIHWTDHQPRGEKVHTRTAALQLAANVTAWSLAGCSLIVLGLLRRLPQGQTLHTTVSRLLLTVSGIGLLTYAMTPKVADDPLTVRRVSESLAREQTERIGHLLQTALADRFALPDARNLDADAATGFLEEQFEHEINHRLSAAEMRNLYTGEPLRLEASPGHLSLSPRSRGWSLHWHDFDGAAKPQGTPIDAPFTEAPR